MKLLLAVTVLSLLLYSIQAANIPQDEEIKAVMDKEGQEVHAQFKRDNEESHAVTARSLSNITVTECHKTITGYNRPFYIQIVGNEVFLIEYGTNMFISWMSKQDHGSKSLLFQLDTQKDCLSKVTEY